MRHAHDAALERQLLRGAAIAAGEPPPGVVQRGVGGGVGRHVPHRHAGELLQAEIGARGEPHHVQALLEQADERHEQGAVQSVLVEFLGRHVRRGDDDDATLEQLREQPPENHGVGDVGDVEFIEAEQPRLLRQLDRREVDRVFAGVLAEFHLLAERMNALVHVDHEFVEMRATFAHHRTCLEKQIHQHGLAAPDIAVDVEALDPRLPGFAAAEQPAQRRRFARQSIFDKPRLKPRQPVDDGELRDVALDFARGDAGGVSRCDGARHILLTVAGKAWRERQTLSGVTRRMTRQRR